MNAKLVTVIMLLMLSVSTAKSQELRFGALAGINFQNLNGKYVSGDRLESSLILGYHAGVNALIGIAPEIYFQPGLLFSTKGGTIKQTAADVKFRLNYIELPLNVLYRGQIGEGFVLLGFGPYLGYAINGKAITGDIKRNIQFQSSIGSGDSNQSSYFRAFDAGANIFAGYEMASGIFLQLNTQLGLLKINPDNNTVSNDKSVVKNTGYGLSVGYRF
jgi:hypothetical protein